MCSRNLAQLMWFGSSGSADELGRFGFFNAYRGPLLFG